jgi:hypothetical protein
MGKKWDVEKLERIYEVVESYEFRKMIEECADLVYFEFCQLQKDSSECVFINEVNSLEKAA